MYLKNNKQDILKNIVHAFNLSKSEKNEILAQSNLDIAKLDMKIIGKLNKSHENNSIIVNHDDITKEIITLAEYARCIYQSTKYLHGMRQNCYEVYLENLRSLTEKIILLQDERQQKNLDFANEFAHNLLNNNIEIDPDILSSAEKYAKFILEKFELLEQNKNETNEEEDHQNENKDENQSEHIDDEKNEYEENQTPKIENLELSSDISEDKTKLEEQKLEQEHLEKDNIAKITKPTDHNFTDNKYEYKIFTKEFDEINFAHKLINNDEKEYLKKQLLKKYETYSSLLQPLIKKLRKQIIAYERSKNEINQFYGQIDPKKLCQIAINPYIENPYRKNIIEESNKSLVTLLIDNSGSMRGHPIEIASICSLLISETFEKCNVDCEILGFTTKNWKGGHSYLKWLRESSPPKPGRLNDLRHIIYKTKYQNCNFAKENLGLMFKEGILKENIDGEALIWAVKRSLQGSYKRRIIIVISDGAPIDDATCSTNEKLYLDKHLLHIIKQIEKNSKIELSAIGIGHNVNKFYENAIMIKTIDELATTLIEKLYKLFSYQK